MRVEIYSDTICPWCYVGLKRFAQAVQQRPAIEFEVQWLAFELNPDLAVQGVDRESYLSEKFGGLERLRGREEQIRAVGEPLGIRFQFDLIRKTPNTRASHALLALAAEQGRQGPMVEALFRAYAEQGQDIGDREVLVELGAAQGLPPEEVRQALIDQRHYPAILAQEHQAQDWGVSGVPTFIIERRYAVSGAQEPPVLVQVFDRLQDDGGRRQPQTR